MIRRSTEQVFNGILNYGNVVVVSSHFQSCRSAHEKCSVVVMAQKKHEYAAQKPQVEYPQLPRLPPPRDWPFEFYPRPKFLFGFWKITTQFGNIPGGEKKPLHKLVFQLGKKILHKIGIFVKNGSPMLDCPPPPTLAIWGPKPPKWVVANPTQFRPLVG